MERVWGFVKTTLIGGLLVVLPVGVLTMLVLRLVAAARGWLAPLTSKLGLSPVLTVALVALVLMAICFVTGLVLRTRLGKRFARLLEHGVLNKVPSYALLRKLSSQFAGEGEGVKLKPALFETGEGLVPAFIVEEHEGGIVTVFVPAVPTPTAGQVYIVPRERVHPVDVPLGEAVSYVRRWGIGANALLKAANLDEIDLEKFKQAS